jgi:hypothetical protein
MTIASEQSKVTYQGDGAATAFSIPFKFIQNGDIRVVLRSEDGAESELLLGADYALSGAGDPSGGSCVLTRSPALGQTLTLVRDPELVQGTDYQENDYFSAEAHEAALDLLTMIAQANRERIERALMLPVSNTGTSPSVPTPSPGSVLAWGESGNLVNGPQTGDIDEAAARADAAETAAAAAIQARAASEAARDEALLQRTHNSMLDRSEGDCHPIEAITGLAEAVGAPLRVLGGEAWQSWGLAAPLLELVAYAHRNAATGAPDELLHTRETAGMAVDAGGFLRVVAPGSLRHDCDPETGTYLGWLIERNSENLLLRSDDFSSASWTKTNATVTPSAVVGPDGETGADAICETAATGGHHVSQSVSAAVGEAYTYSVFLRRGARHVVNLSLSDNGGANTFGMFDLKSGAVLTGAGEIVAHPGGWYRCSVSMATAGGTLSCFLALVDEYGELSYSGTEPMGVYAALAQLEAGRLTSPIATGETSAGRSETAPRVDLSGYPLRPGTGTLFLEAVLPKDAADGDALAALVSADGNGLILELDDTGRIVARISK